MKKKIKEAGYPRYIHEKESDKAYFHYDIAYGEHKWRNSC